MAQDRDTIEELQERLALAGGGDVHLSRAQQDYDLHNVCVIELAYPRCSLATAISCIQSDLKDHRARSPTDSVVWLCID